MVPYTDWQVTPALTNHSTDGQYLKHELAELEAALVRFALSRLVAAGFQLVSVPDLLNSAVLEACGVSVHGDRTMVSARGPPPQLRCTVHIANMGANLISSTLTSKSE